MLIVKNAVKDAAGSKNVSADFYDKLNEKVQDLVDRAAERAEANGRKTIQARDL
ncbi:DNA-binding protein [candidate division MSBL1 archaeon SCGC-AAA382A20]|uniref:DNA-binding protein n=1 Tax=candidate division MSBL1 archaeon SCGC-AAA382A20 TaxID=1698280 RepID=A0A133VKQ4_9EURY|nr:DNA-binding protein [candidate division MSBL1 archaeon SCGC-AAA382A20]